MEPELVAYLDERFGALDQRFEAIDHRFEAMDRRFDAADQQLGAMNRRLGVIEQRQEATDGRLEDTRRHLGVLIENLDQKIDRVRDELSSEGKQGQVLQFNKNLTGKRERNARRAIARPDPNYPVFARVRVERAVRGREWCSA